MKTTTKNKGGRPRNPRLDEIMAELAVTRRHAKRILKDEQEKPAAPAPMSPNPVSAVSALDGMTTLAKIRAKKLLREIELLEVKVRQAALDERHQAGELLYLDEARELVLANSTAIANVLRGMPKTLSPRMAGQPQKAIENTLAEWSDRVLALCAAAVGKVKSNRKI